MQGEVVQKQSSSVLVHLQVLRAIAASLVVVDHSIAPLRLSPAPPVYRHAAFLAGHAGVTAFFVLSGFIMVWQSAPLAGSVSGAAAFLWRRVLRIVPMYWAMTLFILPFEIRGMDRPLLKTLLSLLFVPNWLVTDERLVPVLGHGWTLNYEMFFYVLFALCLLLTRRKGIAWLVLVMAAVSQSYHLVPAASQSPAALLRFYCSPILLLFVYGALIGFFFSELPLQRNFRFPISPAFLVLLPILLLFLFPATLGNVESWDFLSICSVAVVLLCVIAANPSGNKLRWLVFLGNASYCTYLAHLTVLPLAWALGRRLGGGTAGMVIMVLVAVAAANLLGAALHVFVERPLTNRLRKLPFFPAPAGRVRTPTYTR